jgi:hypothetical protein
MLLDTGNEPRRVPRKGRPRIGERLAARLHAFALDCELARGVPPDASVPLSLRARTLTQPSTRDELARQLRWIVRRAREPARLGPRVPLRRREVSAEEDGLKLLASRLQAPVPVGARGVAQVRVLISDGGGPLYHRGSADQLGRAVREATAALG